MFNFEKLLFAGFVSTVVSRWKFTLQNSFESFFFQKTWSEEKRKIQFTQNALIHFRGSFSTFSSIIQFFAPSLSLLFAKILYNDGLRRDWISTLLNWFLFEFFLLDTENMWDAELSEMWAANTEDSLKLFTNSIQKQVIKRAKFVLILLNHWNSLSFWVFLFCFDMQMWTTSAMQNESGSSRWWEDLKWKSVRKFQAAVTNEK